MVLAKKDSTLAHKSQGIESTVVSDVIRPKYLGLGYQGLIYHNCPACLDALVAGNGYSSEAHFCDQLIWGFHQGFDDRPTLLARGTCHGAQATECLCTLHCPEAS